MTLMMNQAVYSTNDMNTPRQESSRATSSSDLGRAMSQGGPPLTAVRPRTSCGQAK
jgi:hypothetical protein